MDYSELLSSKLTILIVESDERVLKRLSVWIKAIANEVEATTSPLEALEILESRNIDILFFNADMQFMGAMEFLSKAKAIKDDQVSVLMFDSIDVALFKESISLGVDKYLNVPIDAKMLIQVVEDLAHEKVFQLEFAKQNRSLSEYKQAIERSFVLSKHLQNGDIESVNSAFCKLFMVEEDEAYRYNPLFKDGKKDATIWAHLDKKDIYRGRKEYKLKSDKIITVDLTVVPILNDEGGVEEYICFINDVTQLIESSRKLNEEKIQRLMQIKAHNEQMNRVKDSFLTVFTHELRTPLNAIINFSEHVNKQISRSDLAKKETILEELVAIKSSGVSMLDMINNVMDAIKLRDKRIMFTMSHFSVVQTLKGVIERLEYLNEGKSVEFKAINDAMISSDQQRFVQIFLNVIANAIKYSRSKVKIITKSSETKFGVVVEDDGEGFHDTSKVFELFEQLSEDEMTRTASGIGVGLFIVKQLCDAFGYNIALERSTALGGARVTITGGIEAKNEQDINS